ncbi:MAG: glycosyltransferase [Pseudotabrizicola sp.]|uniref:glycosyltransferase n=1 Tax=Pseudotabrizicola sp. TaxID=2939647 RepID=UPI00271DBEA5|nr:glycosyltransferase [Pseudotabrizicola sp.]MDO8883783.1 glycosyltransferase [Pseudotabrizicola sp.]MDP2081858.1 glycosyltransferase [Pseudotabrizicola sp.]MDZ7573852.1 glycosyltransferase [Pseudotabrizicola sp.]
MTLIVDAVVIGRNEGDRLVACLSALRGRVRRVVYVDSGSTDASVAVAQGLGAKVIILDMDRPFTAARARNAGLLALAETPPTFVQFVDGDCVLDPGWLPAAIEAFSLHPTAVVVCGRRRERFPEASAYNAMADREWNTPVGEAKACGGDALMRFAPVLAAGGYRDDLIAGEEPELCLRLRRAGGTVWRIDAEMTLHDAALVRFGQWWKRMVRSGHAFAEGAELHGAGPERHWVVENRRALKWGVAGPLIVIIAGLFHPAGWALALAYPAQVLRLSRRGGWTWALLTVAGRFAEATGALGFYLGQAFGRRRKLIEYK